MRVTAHGTILQWRVVGPHTRVLQCRSDGFGGRGEHGETVGGDVEVGVVVRGGVAGLGLGLRLGVKLAFRVRVRVRA